MQPPKVRTVQKPTVCPCGTTTHAPKSKGQRPFDAGVQSAQFSRKAAAHTDYIIYTQNKKWNPKKTDV